jgi:transcriptional antiterminator NusG
VPRRSSWNSDRWKSCEPRFEIDDEVRVSDGPFARLIGTVTDVDDMHEKLTVAVSIFGRATPVELEFAQVEKL